MNPQYLRDAKQCAISDELVADTDQVEKNDQAANEHPAEVAHEKPGTAQAATLSSSP